MKRFLLLLAGVALLSPGAVLAQADKDGMRAYVTGNAGFGIVGEAPTTATGAAFGFPIEGRGDVQLDDGIDVAGGGGVVVPGVGPGNIRAELIIGYSKNDVHKIDNGSLSVAGFTFNAGGAINANGDTSRTSLKIGGFYDYPVGAVEVYAGARVGMARVRWDINSPAGLPLALDDSSTDFIYDIEAGMNYPIGDNVVLFAAYTYEGVGDSDLTMTVPIAGDFAVSIDNPARHVFKGGVRFLF